jgi:translocation and assembly module TamB
VVNASGTVYGIDIRLEVSGYADEPKLLFSSTPPLSSSQILALLTTGELPGSTGYLSNRDRAGRLMFFLGNDFISRYLGSDSIQDRLTISSGQAISTSGKSTYSLEYKLTDRWSVVGEYDRFDALNAQVKWKIYSK